MTFSPVAKGGVANHKKEYRRDYYKRNIIDKQLDESSKTQEIEKKFQMLVTKKNLDSKSPLRVTGSGFITEKLIYW